MNKILLKIFLFIFVDIVLIIKSHSGNRQWIITQPKFLKDLETFQKPSQAFKLMGFTSGKCQSYLKNFPILSTCEQSANNLEIKTEESKQKNQQSDEFEISNIQLDELIDEEKKIEFIEKLQQIGIFDHPCSLQFLNLISEFWLSRNYKKKFQHSVDFYEQIIQWSFNKIDNWCKFDEKSLEKVLQNISLKKFVSDEKFDLFNTEDGSKISAIEAANVAIEMDELPDCEIYPYKSSEDDFFIDRAFEVYFVTKYAFENAFYVEDDPIEDECAMRVNLLLTFACMERTQDYRSNFFMKIMLDFIERDHKMEKYKKYHNIDDDLTSNRRKFFTPAIYKLAELKYALIDLTFPYYTHCCNQINNFCKFFKYDKESLDFLWRINENETIVNWWAKEFHDSCESSKFTNEMIKMARNFFNEDEILKLKAGKHQLGNLMYRIWKNEADFEKEEEEKEEEEMEVQTLGDKFADVFSVDELYKNFEYDEEISLTPQQSEVVEETLIAGNPPNSSHLAVLEAVNSPKTQNSTNFENIQQNTLVGNSPNSPHDECLNAQHPRDSPHFKELSAEILQNSFSFFELLAYLEKFLSTQEMLQIILCNSHKIFTKYVKNVEIFNSVWTELEKTATKEELAEMLLPHRMEKLVYFSNAFESSDPTFLEGFFEKFEKYLSDNSIIEVLLQRDTNLKNSLSLAIWSKSKKVFDVYWNFMLKYFKGQELKDLLLNSDTDFLTAFHHATIRDSDEIFNFVLEFYHNNLEIREFRKLFTAKTDFLTKMVANSSLKICKTIALQTEILHGGDKTEMAEFLMQNGSRNVFNIFKNQEVYRSKLKPFVKLLRRTFDENGIADDPTIWSEGFESKFDCETDDDDDDDDD